MKEKNVNEMVGPNFFGVGAAKSGTTSLYHFLYDHPGVYMSPIKETNFFSSDIDPSSFSESYKLLEKQRFLDINEYLKGDMKTLHWGYFVQKEEQYLKLFRNARGEKAIGEISNSYLYSQKAAENIAKKIPNAKIFMILRNPIERAYSHYLANLRDGKTHLSFMQALKRDMAEPEKGWYISELYVELGLYYTQVKRYLEVFPKSQLRIYLYDDLRDDPASLLGDLLSFLGVSKNGSEGSLPRTNAARIPKNPYLLYLLTRTGLKKWAFNKLVPVSMRDKIRSLFFQKSKIPRLSVDEQKFLMSIFREDILLLEGLIERDLGNWLTYRSPGN